ncbi:hypothetical protein LCGC14_2315200 [marine sediment metagenome]|uniref:Uncharacterized protein n=1 Tax=marine sediment metagenome TaxID=412755 RepID=A0A0F9FEB9_9ZZZZ
MKELERTQYLKIKQEYKKYKELREKLGLSSSNIININVMKKKLQPSSLVKKNE